MKRSVIAMALAAALWATAAGAAGGPLSRQVILYPSGGQVLETWELTFQEGRAVVALPPEAQSLVRFDLEEGTAAELSLRPLTQEAQESPRIAALRSDVAQAQRALTEAQAKIQALEAQMAFWKAPPIQVAKVGDLNQIGQKSAQELQNLVKQMAQAQEAQAAASQGLDRAKSALVQAAPETPPVQRQLEIQLPYGLNGTRQGVLSYAVDDCGWTPGYRLDAQTGKDQVTLVRTGRIVQRSGSDWDGVQVVLLSGASCDAVTPPELDPWRIQRLQDAPMAMRAMAAPAPAANASRPQYYEGAAAAIWDLGRRDLKSGQPLELELNRQSWKAQFWRVAQPFQGSSAYLMAQLAPGAAIWLPSAPAQFFVNGLYICEGSFEMTAQDEEIFFGVDPLVSVTMKQQRNQSGDRGILTAQQSRTWEWTIEAVNGHRSPVKVRIRDAQPQSGDQDLVVTVDSDPQPATRGRTLFWDLELAPGEKRSLRHRVTFTAPREMEVHPGRR